MADTEDMNERSSSHSLSEDNGNEPETQPGLGWRERYPLIPWLLVVAVLMVAVYVTVLRILIARRSEEWWTLTMLLLTWAPAFSLVRFFRGEPPPVRLMWFAAMVSTVVLILVWTGAFE